MQCDLALSCRLAALAIAIGLALSPSTVVTHATAPDRRLEARIDFDASCAEEILYDPETILADPDRFWRTNPTYRLVAMWHEHSKEPIPRAHWVKGLEDLAAVPAQERRHQPAGLILRQVMDAVAAFRQEAVAHICSFLPEEGTELTTTIHLTAETHPRAFQIHDHIVLDITNEYYHSSARAILSCLVHEVFHIGYGNQQRLRRELDLDDATVNAMLNSLQNEGLATYVAYTAQHLFPAPDDRDFAMLERERDVKIRRHKVNELFRRAKSGNPGDLWGAFWSTGIRDRGYYVVGAYMAKTIDERLGREALIATVAQGPRAFVRVYNQAVDESMRLAEFEDPIALTRQQQIRKAAFDRDASAMRDLLRAYTSGQAEPETALEHTLVSAAIMLQQTGEMEMAVEMLGVNAAIHPQSSAAYQYLADAYARGGRREKAVECYHRSIELDPDGISAFNSEQALAGAVESE